MTGKALVLTLLVALSAGCIGKRSGGTAFSDREWERGVTAKRDVVEAWGNPDSIEDDTWIWRETRHLGGKIKASYYGIGIAVSRMNVATLEHHLEFDSSGKLVKHETHSSVPSGARWSINPFD